MQQIDTKRFKEIQQQEDDLAVVNVLPIEQFRHRHIPGSDNVPLAAPDFVEQVASVAGGPDEPVVVYCTNEDCDASKQAANRLEQAGFRRVYDYTGGVDAWQAAGFPLQAGLRPGA